MNETGEIKGAVATPDRGARTRPIRKRGYHRALKRGELWALNEHMFKTIACDLNQQLFSPRAPDIFIRMAGLSAFLKDL